MADSLDIDQVREIVWEDVEEAPRWDVVKKAAGLYVWTEWPLDDDLLYVSGEELTATTHGLDGELSIRWPWDAVSVAIEGLSLSDAIELVSRVLPMAPAPLSLSVGSRVAASDKLDRAIIEWDGNMLRVDP